MDGRAAPDPQIESEIQKVPTYPKLTAQKALKYAAEWYLAQFNGEDIFDLSIQQINEYSDL